MSRRRPAPLVLLALLALLLAGCGLPVGHGVQAPGAVAAQPALPQPIGVLPPDPQPGATPTALVQSFLAAQTSARDGHRVARDYLASEQRSAWKDSADVTVYNPDGNVGFTPTVEGSTAVVTVRLDVVGGVHTDCSAYVQAPVSQTQTYRMRKDAAGQWRLVGLPDGLTLTPGGRDRTFSAADVYFLAPAVGSPAARHLVADRLLLPNTDDRAQRTVERLLAGPSSNLGSSAATAVPAGTRLLTPVVTSANGEVTVTLSREAGAANAQQRQDLTAQLFWTLRPQVPAFTRLRLLIDGSAPAVSTAGPARQAWASYDPAGPRPDAPAYALANGELDALGRQNSETDRAAPLKGVVGIVDAAVDPRVQTVAVLQQAGGTRTLRVGPLAGSTGAGGLSRGPSDPGLASPSWGSGERGVWLLRTGPSPALLLVAADGSTGVVRVEGMPVLGPQPVLRVSRDGVRLALVAGGVLYVGRIVPTDEGRNVRVVDLRVLPTAAAEVPSQPAPVLDVAWQTGTTLVALVADTEAPRLPLVELSVDGTSITASGLAGVAQGDPVAVAASGALPLLVETVSDRTSRTYREDTDRRSFEGLPLDARRPFYPG